VLPRQALIVIDARIPHHQEVDIFTLRLQPRRRLEQMVRTLILGEQSQVGHDRAFLRNPKLSPQRSLHLRVHHPGPEVLQIGAIG
jgi:hypothetical protein